MTIKNTIAALALAVATGLFGSAAQAAPVSPAHNIGVTQKLTEPVHYRGYRHCHWRYGHRRCHGGYAYYGPSIYLGFGGRRHHHHHFRGFRHGGGHMMRGPGRMHHGRRG